MQLAWRFKAMYQSLGMDLAACAKYLHVTERTLHNWLSGKHDIPFVAYKLLRTEWSCLAKRGMAGVLAAASCGRLRVDRLIQWMPHGGDCWYVVRMHLSTTLVGSAKELRERHRASLRCTVPGVKLLVPRLRPWDGAKRRP